MVDFCVMQTLLQHRVDLLPRQMMAETPTSESLGVEDASGALWSREP